MSKTWTEFLSWEKASKETIDFKTVYVDMVGKRGVVGNRKNKKTGEVENGDIVPGLFLSQIVYWYLPSKSGEPKLRVKKHDHYWIVKKPEEWYEEIRLTPANYRTAVKRLEDENLIVVKAMKDPFDKNRQKNVTHIRLNIPEFIRRWNLIMKSMEDQLVHDDSGMARYYEGQMAEAEKMAAETLRHIENVDSTISENVELTFSKGNVDSAISLENVDSTVSLYTENTFTEINTENINKESIYQEIKQLNVHKEVIDVLVKKIDRLIRFSIDPFDIQIFFNQYKAKLGVSDFSAKLAEVLDLQAFTKGFTPYFRKSLNKLIEDKAKAGVVIKSSKRVESSYDDDPSYEQLNYLRSGIDAPVSKASLATARFKAENELYRRQLTSEEIQLLKNAGEWHIASSDGFNFDQQAV